MSLARKYRPKKFSELTAQDPIVQALLGSLKVNHPPQAFLFSGIRGTGKTTLARLFAATLNCTNPKGCEQSPECENCKPTREGVHEDVVEIDGASYNSVEDVRKLRETVLYLPKRGKKKVFIIDEVHMLSGSAFNALLKTLEEPPKHVVFLFATTELTKLPDTIIGRCQTFHLRRIPHSLVVKRLEEVLKAENISYEIEALNLIAEKGEGSLRDALSLLDQALALGAGKITLKATETMMAYVPFAEFLELWNSLMAQKSDAMLMALGSLQEKGHETKMLAQRLALTTRNAWMLRALPSHSIELQKLGLSAHELSLLETSSKDIAFGLLSSLFSSLVTCLSQLTSSSLDRYILENTLLEWCYSQTHSFTQTSQISSPKLPQISPAQTPIQAKTKTKINQIPPQPPLAPKAKEVPVTKKPAISKSKAPSALKSSPSSKSSSASPHSLPKSWQELLQTWQTKQPLQTHELSQLKNLTYNEHLIELALDTSTTDGKSLLAKERQLHKNLATLFGFQGMFRFSHTSEAAQSKATSNTLPEAGNHRAHNPQYYSSLPQAQYIAKIFPNSSMHIQHKAKHPKHTQDKTHSSSV